MNRIVKFWQRWAGHWEVIHDDDFQTYRQHTRTKARRVTRKAAGDAASRAAFERDAMEFAWLQRVIDDPDFGWIDHVEAYREAEAKVAPDVALRDATVDYLRSVWHVRDLTEADFQIAKGGANG